MKHLAIVGFGQMGASLAAAWRPGLRVTCVDTDAATRTKAVERGWADEATDSLDACGAADATLLAVPVRTAIEILPRVLAAMPPHALLLDVASTKSALVEAFGRAGRPHPYVSLHPLAGNEGAGIDSADPALFRGAPFLILPVRSTEETLEDLERRIAACGARPIRMSSAGDHDAAMAVTIHLPHVLAYALPHLAKQSGTDLSLAGRSFRDTTRVAQSDVRMVRDFLTTNAAPTAAAIDRLIALLGRFRALLLAGDEAGLTRLMEEAREMRARLPRG